MLCKAKRKININRILILVVIFSIIAAVPVFAEGESFKNFYLKNADILSTNAFYMSAFHSIGWFLIELLVKLGEATQGIYDTAFGFIDLTTFPQINDFILKFKPVFIALTAVSLVYLGIMLIMRHEKKPNVATNICIAILCVSCSTFMFSTLNSLTHTFKAGIDNYSYEGNQKAVYSIVNDNMNDVLKLYTKFGTGLNPKQYNKISAGVTENNFSTIDINEVINYSNTKLNLITENPFKYRIYGNDANGNPLIAKNSNGWGINDGEDADFGNEFYYRYNFQYLSAYIELIALIIIYIAMAYKVFRVAIELVFARLLAYLYSAELSGGEKIKKILVFIRDSYILLGVSLISIKLYQIFTSAISGVVGDGLVAALFSLFLAFVVIDGPNLVERLLGMDVGLKSSTARMLAAWGTARGIAKGGAKAVFGDSSKGIGAKYRGAGAIKNAKTFGGWAGNKLSSNSNRNGNDSKSSAESGSKNTDTTSNSSSVKEDSGSSASTAAESNVNAGNSSNSSVDKGNSYDNALNKKHGNSVPKSDSFEPKKRRNTAKTPTSMPRRRTDSKSSFFDERGDK